MTRRTPRPSQAKRARLKAAAGGKKPTPYEQCPKCARWFRRGTEHEC